MHVPRAIVLVCVLLVTVIAVSGWQASRQKAWEYAVVEVGSVSQMRSNVFFLDQEGYHDLDLGAGQGSTSKRDSVSTNTDLRLRMSGKALAKLGNEGWETRRHGPDRSGQPLYDLLSEASEVTLGSGRSRRLRSHRRSGIHAPGCSLL